MGITGSILAGGLERTVADGSLVLALPIAVAAGLVSFLSPCVLPLVPGYLGYVTGLTGVDLEQQRRGRMVAGMLLFVLGFTAVYVLIGWTAGSLGAALAAHQQTLSRVLGGVTVVLGLVYLGLAPRFLSGLEGTRRLDVRPAAGLGAAPLLGAAFGLSWTACTGPTLAVIVNLGLIGGDPDRGIVLAVAYCLGLGIPFLLAGLAYRRAMGAFEVVRRHRALVTRIGGVMLVIVGLLLATGAWGHVLGGLKGLITGFEPVL
jgi:cytochrome c-type biogenesis protein